MGTANASHMTRFKQAGNASRISDSAADPDEPVTPRTADMLSTKATSLQLRAGAPGRRFTDRDEHLFFWTPLLVGLSELTFDPRPKVRYSSLEVLFNILTEHGHCFTESFWQQVRRP